jgi:hypothetical protein
MRPIIPASLLALLLAACGGGGGDDDGGDPDIALCAADQGPFSTTIDNAYLPFIIGEIHILEGLEGGTDPAHLEIEAMDETADVGGVTTRVVEERGDTGDPQRNFYAQAPDGTVCIYGEDEDSDGTLEWEAGADGYLAAIAMPAAPAVGMTFENAHGPDGAERAEVTYVGEPTTTPAETFADTITLLEDGPSIKKYARGVGLIYDDGIELISR